MCSRDWSLLHLTHLSSVFTRLHYHEVSHCLCSKTETTCLGLAPFTVIKRSVGKLMSVSWYEKCGQRGGELRSSSTQEDNQLKQVPRKEHGNCSEFDADQYSVRVSSGVSDIYGVTEAGEEKTHVVEMKSDR